MKKLALTGLLLLAAGSAATAGEYKAGDFHQHTYYTDGSHVFADQMAEDARYLDWWANSEHGGSRNRDGEGDSWLNTDKYPRKSNFG